MAIFVNTYHHIDGRVDYFRRFQSALRPGGRLVVIDWKKDGDPAVGPARAHRVAAAQVRDELEAAGYRRIESLDFLPYQYGEVYRLQPRD